MKVKKLVSLINESNNSYENMFDFILKSNNISSIIKTSIKITIERYRKEFKRSDRIIWLLRLYKLQVMNTIRNDWSNDTNISNTEKNNFKNYEKYFNYIISKYNISYGYLEDIAKYNNISLYNIETELKHFLSLPIPTIQNFQFSYQNPTLIMNHFSNLEEKWKETRKNTIIPKPDDKIILQFPDKSAWFLLPRGACSDEADAMGHCGNGYDNNDGTRILSYRTFKNKQWYVHLTFILDPDGYLGEMKGRGNDKPVPKYFPYIVDLLIQGNKSGLIKGIKGGGYKPQNNFSISDLPETQQIELINLNPELCDNLELLYKIKGKTIELINKIGDIGRQYINRYEFSYDDKTDSYIIDTEKNIDHFVKQYADMQFIKMYDNIIGEGYLDIYTDYIDINDVSFIYSHLPRQIQNKIDEYVENKYSEDDRDRYDNYLELLDQNGDDLYYDLETAYRYGVEDGTRHSFYKQIISSIEYSEIEQYGNGKTDIEFKILFPYNNDNQLMWDKPVKIAVSFNDAFKGCTELKLTDGYDNPFEFNIKIPDISNYDNKFDIKYAVEYFIENSELK